MRSRLATCTCAASEPGVAFSADPGAQRGTGNRAGLRHAKSAGFHGSYPGHWFLQGQKLLGSSTEQATESHGCSHCMADMGGPSPSFLFHAISICLGFASLWVRCNRSGPFMQCPERLGKLVAYHTLPSLVRGNLSNWGVPAW